MNEKFRSETGLEIVVYISPITGFLVVELNTSDLEEDHVYEGGDEIPRMRIMVNEGPILIQEDGSLVEEMEDE